jgi:murein tripeptide amidase MpaA
MYRRSADIEALLEELVAESPDVLAKLELLPSRMGRPISALRVRGGEEADRAGVLFVGGIHARELLNPDLLVDLVIDLLTHYFDGSDWVMGGHRWPAATVRAIVESIDLLVLPNANPDGREHVFDVERLWRKNRRNNPGTACDGVDLNRNFDLLWGVATRDPSGQATTSRSPCSDLFVGPRAFSEPETRNVKRLLDGFPVDCFVDVHSFSELILHPWGHAPNQTSDPGQRFTLVDTSDWEELPADAPAHEEFVDPDDLARLLEIGNAAADAIHNVRGRSYTVQPGTDLYPTTGTGSDYAYSRHVVDPGLRKVFGFTFETGPEAATVEDSFQPPEPEAERIAEEAASGLVSVLASFARL